MRVRARVCVRARAHARSLRHGAVSLRRLSLRANRREPHRGGPLTRFASEWADARARRALLLLMRLRTQDRGSFRCSEHDEAHPFWRTRGLRAACQVYVACCMPGVCCMLHVTASTTRRTLSSTCSTSSTARPSACRCLPGFFSASNNRTYCSTQSSPERSTPTTARGTRLQNYLEGGATLLCLLWLFVSRPSCSRLVLATSTTEPPAPASTPSGMTQVRRGPGPVGRYRARGACQDGVDRGVGA